MHANTLQFTIMSGVMHADHGKIMLLMECMNGERIQYNAQQSNYGCKNDELISSSGVRITIVQAVHVRGNNSLHHLADDVIMLNPRLIWRHFQHHPTCEGGVTEALKMHRGRGMSHGSLGCKSLWWVYQNIPTKGECYNTIQIRPPPPAASRRLPLAHSRYPSSPTRSCIQVN